ncbi:DNA mismatch repair protein Mlh3 isoform X1 [Micropterus dolomieu]|uniref:DNA mismatch repair protein Mlh3 isoform X1 n=1 Tax=Micropterus dolomieu TaxID=147949 RepID=UPI001E8CAEEC|nr:DNA mismatch repair protein Mlh3 isoform X1 [Micropterus dolomieu]XP_045918805.1 DNA mismatch repair protein Mlh3 isoform X1 [Micropterus dolomieu]
MNTMIKCLPKEVQGKLRSGVAIPSLQQCVEELILNSIDAEATCVGVRMDMEAFKVQVIDNGTGLTAEDMECVGNRYYTSKCSTVEDLDNLSSYGFRGEALASIVCLATLVEISSRTRSSVKTHVKIFNDGRGMDVFEAETTRPSAGTTVVICNFFHNMPVRRKRMDAVLEAERIRHRVEAISLMHPSVSFTLKNDCTGAMTVQLSKARNTYHRFVQIHSLGRAQKLGEISYTHRQFEVVGYIGREGHYSNSLQFLYVNDRLLLKTRIHKLLNFLLRRISSSNKKNDSPEWQSAVRSPKHKRSQELHGVYIINIKCSYSEYDICLEPAKTLIEFKDWDGILLCIEEAVKAFLSRENLVAVLSQDDLDYVSPRLFGTHNTDQEGHNGGTDGQAPCSASTQDCSVGMKLASASVHRKRKEDCVCEESVCPESGPMECEKGTELRQEKITANELEKIKGEGSVSKDCRDESLCDLAGLEPVSHNITEEEEPTFSEADEGSQIFCMSSSVRQLESEELELPKEREIRLNKTSSTSNVTSLDNITQHIQPDLNSIAEQIIHDGQGTGGHGQTLVSNRKISLSNPYIHESLHPQNRSQINKSAFQHHVLAQKCKERCFAKKCKISLDADDDRSCQKLYKDVAPVIPSRIPRLVTCQKLFLCKEFGSLEKFRKVYGKSDEPKLPSRETKQDNDARLAQTDSFVLNSQNLLFCRKDQQDGDFTETQKEETRSSLRSSPTLSVFTKLKPVSVQNRGKTSLAAKLCHLKQHRTDDSKLLPHLPWTTSQDNTALRSANDSIKDSNNNENHCDTALNPEPVPGRRTNPQQVDREEATTSGDWLHHYDTSVGKTVYVNKVTGLSRYEDPPAEETQVRCTSDLTNMAVSVISEVGMEYRCYPFQVDLVLPFLPKSRTERVISSGLDDRDDNGESSNSLTSLYSKWNNPVFVRPPMVGVDISSGHADGLAVKIHNILFPYRFSKAMIHSMKVIHQVDKKFLACLINTRDEEPAALTETEGNLLVLVDQHAAHERVRLENLVADSYEDDPDAPGERRLCSSNILPPLGISVTEEELRLLRSCQPRLRNLGLEVKFSQAAEPHVFVGKVPLCFMEKENNELRRGRPSVIKPIVEEYLREQIELLCSTGRVKGTLPLTVLKVLASLACHGAIKFNDSLSRDECYSLAASLASCQLPFQCAHGRPSIAPLVDILHLDKDQKELQKPNLQKLRRMYKAWELYGNR